MFKVDLAKKTYAAGIDTGDLSGRSLDKTLCFLTFVMRKDLVDDGRGWEGSGRGRGSSRRGLGFRFRV